MVILNVPIIDGLLIGFELRGRFQTMGGIPHIYKVRGGTQIQCVDYSPSNPQTVPQQANRDKFRQAVQYWQGLSQIIKDSYNDFVKLYNTQMSGYNLCIRLQML